MSLNGFEKLAFDVRHAIYMAVLENSDIVIPSADNKTTYRCVPQPAAPGHTGPLVVLEQKSHLDLDEATAVTTVGPKASLFGLIGTSKRITEEFLTASYLHGVFNIPVKLSWIFTWRSYKINTAALRQIRHIRFVRDCNFENSWWSFRVQRVDLAYFVRERPNLKKVETQLVVRRDMAPWLRLKPRSKWTSTQAGKLTGNNIWSVPKDQWNGTTKL